MVDVLSLEGFRATLDGRLSEAHSVKTCLVEVLRRTEPRLGDLPDADHVSLRYQTLYDQHLNRINLLIDALNATRDALNTIMDAYQTNEARQTANVTEIADALGAVSGVHNGGHTNA
jgi:ABC-type transporter Mla subunit MlaD